MRKVKIVFWLILGGLLGLVFWQNQAFLLEKKQLEINYFIGQVQFPELQIALYFLVLFLTGLLISYFSSLAERFMARKTIKKLKEELSHAGIKISELEAARPEPAKSENPTPEAGPASAPAEISSNT
jgi:uncharacterized integral membrane protein